ncbi:hypothetical protein [Sphingomonas psychrotolerans]|nr:hypothetical protein [Sphingomonas psychrotolerans]
MTFALLACAATGNAPATAFAQDRVEAEPDAGVNSVGGGGGGGIAEAVPLPAEKLMVSPGGVDMRTGRFAYRHADLSIGGDKGMALERIGTTQRGQPEFAFGNYLIHNWLITLTQRRVAIPEAQYISEYDYLTTVHVGASAISFRKGSYQGSFLEQSVISRAYVSIVESHQSPTPRGGTELVPDLYQFRDEEGSIFNFRRMSFAGDCGGECVYVSDMTRPDGTRYQFGYESMPQAGTSRLRSVTSSLGYAILFDYGLAAQPKFVTRACVINLATRAQPAASSSSCPADAPSATYNYANGVLTGFTDQSGNATTMNGLGQIYVAGSAQPVVTNVMNAQGVVSYQSFADGRSYSYVWDIDPNFAGEAKGNLPAGGYYVDNESRKVTVKYGAYRHNPGTIDFSYDITPGPELIRDELDRESRFEYCRYDQIGHVGTCSVVSDRIASVEPSGIRREFEYGVSHNLTKVTVHPKIGAGLPDITMSATYDCTNYLICNKPQTVTDANGNISRYTYDAAHGGVLTEMGPGVGGLSPLNRYVYSQRRAWISNGAGGYVPSATSVWLLSEVHTCRNGATTNAGCATGASDEVVTTYDYGPDAGPNNLLLRGKVETADGVSLRSCYQYDVTGNRIAETSPRAALAQCQ